MENEVKLWKYPDIEQFRNAIYNVKHRAQYIGKDENGDAILDETIPLPTLNYRGTVKKHGTNSGIIFTPNEKGEYTIHYQSRERIITPQHDNNGCATFLYTRPLIKLIELIKPQVDEEGNLPIIKVFGEFGGKGIQAKVAVSKLDKFLTIFSVKVGDVWLTEEQLKDIKLPEHRIYNIFDFGKYEITIDFNNPKEAADKIAEMVDSVEKECPIGKYFGVSGVGEGIVFACTDEGWTGSRYWFKAKGEDHKNLKSKEKVPVDIEKVNTIKELVDIVVTEPRLLQGLDKLIENNLTIDIKNIGFFLKWVYNDIMKEDLDIIVGNGIEPKEINGSVSTKARLWFIEKLNEKAGI